MNPIQTLFHNLTTPKTNRERFLNKTSDLPARLQKEVIKDNIAHIPCKVEGMEDIISRYSVPGCESLNRELYDHILSFADCIPSEYPIILDIYGPAFTPEEKKVITDTIASEMAYELGKMEESITYRKRTFLLMMAGTALSGILLVIAKQIFDNVPLEFSYVLFWLFADWIARYLFVDRLDNNEEKIRIGRLASMKVEFKS